MGHVYAAPERRHLTPPAATISAVWAVGTAWTPEAVAWPAVRTDPRDQTRTTRRDRRRGVEDPEPDRDFLFVSASLSSSPVCPVLFPRRARHTRRRRRKQQQRGRRRTVRRNGNRRLLLIGSLRGGESSASDRGTRPFIACPYVGAQASSGRMMSSPPNWLSPTRVMPDLPRIPRSATASSLPTDATVRFRHTTPPHNRRSDCIPPPNRRPGSRYRNAPSGPPSGRPPAAACNPQLRPPGVAA